MKSSSASLQQKTEEFISGLTTDFPHTVNTVFRTGDKVCSSQRSGDECSTCPMCNSPITDTNRAAENVKENGVTKGEGDGGCCGTGDDCGSSCFTLTSDEVKERLCYACNLTFLDMGCNVDVLPAHVVHNATTEVKRERMKDSIKEFLLE